MKEHYYKGNKIIEYCSNDFIGFYFNSNHDILQTRGHSLEEVQQNLDKYDQRSKVS